VARATVLVVSVAFSSGLAGGASHQSNGTLILATLSSRPDLVSGGDTLVEIRGADATVLDDVVVSVNGRDVSRAFHKDDARRSLVGLIEGLQLGRNTITAAAGSRSARLDVTNFPVTGPILSGEHLTPFECRTDESGLGPPLDANCSAPTRVEYFYKSTDPLPPQAALTGGPPGTGFKRLPAAAGPRPADLARTTTIEGATVPYIVRVESGTINRAIYRIAVLDDPVDAAQGPWRPGAGWNRRLLFSFGGGCGTNYNQGAIPLPFVLFDAALSRGFAHAVSTQTVMGQHCNDHLSGEALMMIKEHIIERYGMLKWTVGHGGSGGAIQQLLIAQNFPGLLDGLIPGQTFADSVSVRPTVTDCRLLINYFQTDPHVWTQEKQTAVEGYTPGTCAAWDRSFVNAIVADNAVGCGIAGDLIYDAVKNPRGARCTVWDTNVASFGRDPKTGFARPALDNVGVQYGLQALNRGVISKAEFIDLNEKIGGFDRDGHLRPARTVADSEGIRMAYAAGRLNAMQGLSALPILQVRTYLDAAGNIHSRERDFTVRERLRKSAGRVDNQVLWVFPSATARASGAKYANGETNETGLILDTMSQWLDALASDTSAAPAPEKVRRAKPAAATDACWDLNLTQIVEPATLEGPGRCNQLYPSHRTPRLAAGAPIADDVLKCQLKAIDPKDYRVTFTPEETERLRRVFPGGVCNYAKPGILQQPPAGTYLRLPLK
jgi:hypothetical protein